VLRLVGVLHLLVLLCLAAYVVLLPLLTSRPYAGSQGAHRSVRGLTARPRSAGGGARPTRRSSP
jgi:hypothetical protein